MYNKFLLKQILLVVTVVLFVSCDKDYNEIGASLIGQNNFELADNSLSTVTASWSKTGPIGSNNLDINALGVLDNTAFGQTTARFVTKVQLASESPTIDLTLDQAIDSIKLYVPYITNTKTALTYDTTTGRPNNYTLDSIYGTPTAKLKLKIYENKYFLGDKNTEGGGAPILDSNYPQFYYTNQNSVFNSNRGSLLYSNDSFIFSNKEYKIETAASADGTTTASTSYIAPGMRLDLDKTFFQNLLFGSTSGTYMTTNSVFERYFKGLFFDVAKADTDGVLAMLNFNKGTIIVYYKEKTSSSISTLLSKTITLNLTGNSVNLLSNDFSTSGTEYNSSPLADRLYLRGGEGSVATIDLFNAASDVLTYNRTTKTLDQGTNGIPDELDYIKSYGWLINEASLTFYVDQDAMKNVTDEPNRLFLYDVNNKRPLLDYYYDATTGNSANYSKQTYGGIIEKDANDKGLKYKFRITNYIRNLVNNDSTNVKLGVSLGHVISNTVFKKKGNSTDVPSYTVWQTLTATQKNAYYFPASSIMSPLGTILWGIGSSVPEDKKLKLEIYYTKPN